jgi:serine protease Do
MENMTVVLEELQTTISAAADAVGPAVVGLGRGWGLGSGVVVADGRVLTNAHNVRRDEPTVTFADGRTASGRIAAADADNDLAVIEVDTAGAPAVQWADAAPQLGAAVIALANPGGRGLRATLGFVSAAGRSFRGPRGRRIAGGIEHTAALPRGSAGGPLVDAEGRLLGINTVRLEGGLILALPADAALRARVESLSRGEAPRTPRLGVAVAPPRVARRMRRAVGLPEREGLLVRAVEDGSPAAGAGLQRGDLIVAAGDRDVDGVDSLYAALDGAVGGTLPLTVVRGAEEQELSVELDGGPTAEAA